MSPNAATAAAVTGLHFRDVAQLLDVLHERVDQGNTMIIIEHDLEVVKAADWIIDLGAGGVTTAAAMLRLRARPSRSPAVLRSIRGNTSSRGWRGRRRAEGARRSRAVAR
jgi:hypothetical protein